MTAGIIPADWIAKARGIPLERELERRGIKLHGRIERSGPCPRCGGRDRFSINVKKQVWNCRGCDIGGGVISLVQHIDQTDFTTAVQSLTGGRSPSPSPSAPSPSTPAPSRSSAGKDYESEQHRKAAWLWQQRKPLAGSPAERYLREVRGIDCRLPATLAYLAATKLGHHPAVIAAYGMPDEPEPGMLTEPRDVDAVHLILLKSDGAAKADVRLNKVTIGSPAGLPIILAPPNDLLGLVIAEGIEDALSLHQTTGLGAFAVGGASFMPAVAHAVPAYVECVTIAVDDDDSGRRHAAELAARLAERPLQIEFLEIGR
jgi:putative DNA primase/helicase